MTFKEICEGVKEDCAKRLYERAALMAVFASHLVNTKAEKSLLRKAKAQNAARAIRLSKKIQVCYDKNAGMPTVQYGNQPYRFHLPLENMPDRIYAD